jgi:1,4-dihydroxy-2-naphthoate octaprenyltransferase
VAAAAVYAEHGVAPGLRCAGLVLASILIIAWLNLSNDAFDAATGVDKAKRESVVNLTGGKKGLVLLVANAFLLGGISMLGSLLASIGGDIRPAAMLALAIACGYVYQGPPFRSVLGSFHQRRSRYCHQCPSNIYNGF